MKRLPLNVRILFLFAVCVSIAAAIFSVGGPTQEAQRRAPGSVLAGRYADFAKADRVTAEIRDPSRRLVRVDTGTQRARTAAESIGTIVADYGSFVVVSSSAERKVPRGVDILKTTVHLPGASFDPAASLPEGSVVGEAVSVGADEGYYLVQLGTIANDELLDSLRDAGVEILQYIPNQAFYVHGSTAAVAKAAAHSRVRWVGAHRPEHKISLHVREQLAIARGVKGPRAGVASLEYTSGSTSRFNISFFKREELGRAASRVIDATGGRIVSISDLPNNYFNVVQVEASVDIVEQIANIPGVISIEPVYTRRAEDERSSQIIAGNYTNSTTINAPGYDPLAQFGVDGTNVTVTVSDDGANIPGNGPCYISSANTVHGPAYNGSAGAASGHGHLNASIIAGAAFTSCGLDGSGYNYGVGVAPKAHIVNLPFLNNSSSDAQGANDAVTVAGPNGVMSSVSNNSWGVAASTNSYGAYEAEYDGYARDASTAGTIDPLVLIFSAGNQGPSGSLTRPKVAKNLIAVGSSENLRPEIGGTAANSLEDVSTFSSRGPAFDGRIKPDIIAPGGVITGSRTSFTCTPGVDPSCPGYNGAVDANHVYSSGTSHAAPQIAGVAALFTQFWKNGHGGINPSPAMVKAAIINTGQNLTGNGATGALPNGSEGWGRVNMKFMFNTGTTVSHFDQLSTLGTVGALRNYAGSVTDASKPVRVTLVWTDPPGTVDPALVNNLDLAVTVGGNTYRGNVFSNGVSTTGGNADAINNVENVWLPAGLTGPVTATVTATAINGDGVLGNVDLTDQNFALVFYNADVSAMLDVSGRVITSQGRGVTNAIVTLTDNMGFTLTRVTGRNGIYQFTGVPGGRTYTVSVSSRRFTFQPKTFAMNDNVAGLDFTSSP